MKTRKTYILDANILIHDPESIFNFQEHEVVLPFEALEELYNLKKQHDQKGYYGRQAIRQLGDLIEKQDVSEGMTSLDDGNTVPSVIDEMRSRNEVSIQKIGHVTLNKTIRSPIASLAAELL